MHDLIKKISMALLIVSLGWLPVQVASASSFFMSDSNAAKVMVAMQADSGLSLAVHENHNTEKSTAEKSAVHCEMHKITKDHCTNKSACNSDQDCEHCLHFMAMAQVQQQANFLPFYSIQNSYAYSLSGITNVSAYRPPR